MYKMKGFSENQLLKTRTNIRKSIFFLLLCVDPQTKEQYPQVDVDQAFDNLLRRLDGLNELFEYPIGIIETCALLAEANKEYHSESFDFAIYRKLIFDAGSACMKIGGG